MGKVRLTGAGFAVLVAIVLFAVSILYATFQPKHVEYIYKQAERFFYPHAPEEPQVPNPNRT